jgi:3-methyl-2-oxobutanoate hydroxymethyltransferase
MVKLEGGAAVGQTVESLVAQWRIPVCAHLGLTPQHVHQLGGYRVQGRDEARRPGVARGCPRPGSAGAAMLVLECVPAPLAREVARSLAIPVIGIGAGADVDGQVLVLYDMLGISCWPQPRFVHDFMAEAGSVDAALAAYVSRARAQFPRPNTAGSDAAPHRVAASLRGDRSMPGAMPVSASAWCRPWVICMPDI